MMFCIESGLVRLVDFRVVRFFWISRVRGFGGVGVGCFDFGRRRARGCLAKAIGRSRDEASLGSEQTQKNRFSCDSGKEPAPQITDLTMIRKD